MKTKLVGILNITPDSFSDGGNYFDVDSALAHAKELFADGADFIDIGAQATNPNAKPISPQEEFNRIRKFVELFDYPFSIDTFNPEVAEFALSQGAMMINCVKSEMIPKMIKVAKKYNVPVVVTADNKESSYKIDNIAKLFNKFRFDYDKLIYDPGFGFHGSPDYDRYVLTRIDHFTYRFKPMMVGISRKSFIGQITGEPVHDRDLTSAVFAAWCAVFGVEFIRTHNIKLTRKFIIDNG